MDTDTRINVRGCRKHPIDNDNDSVTHPRKKPKNRINSVSISPSITGSRRQTRSVTAAQQREKLAIEKANRTVSSLESLPGGILEMIFIYSLNVNFARASPIWRLRFQMNGCIGC